MDSIQRLPRSRSCAWGSAIAMVLALLTLGIAPAHAQKNFSSPEAAMNAFGEAVATSDDDAMKSLLGANYHELIPPVGAEIRHRFLEAWSQSHAIRPEGGNRARIAAGNDGWTLPIPLVKTAKGWHFDTRAGVAEMQLRRIGSNELAVMQTLLAVCDAQNEYAQMAQKTQGMSVYAAKLVSSPGKHDGLYWPTKPGEAQSPLGPAFLEAGMRSRGQGGYYGYRYKLLTSQGSHAPGGKYDYLVNGKLFGGFAVIAWPVRYGDTGIKSFMVSHDGRVFERDLGPDSAAKAVAIRSFDPGPGWTEVTP
ncbi:hypothetical protein CNE_BB1p10950 (plasmid) [Cupriavidus necator N-1]|uniref:DUF2950 domain-containing protein n=1 Tax=Cupriavidus necator (strain ATCC 43291 / DSM 13513 / CCUG 52238 / LMG 8453 / N-1) TaxID=1042878 RepID=F8GUU9_CUPNN|nr:hypothetical protein CNE_BB1p10950 [Cupriavidus necator N-1]